MKTALLKSKYLTLFLFCVCLSPLLHATINPGTIEFANIGTSNWGGFACPGQTLYISDNTNPSGGSGQYIYSWEIAYPSSGP